MVFNKVSGKYGERVPLTDSQKEYVINNHKRMSRREMADNLGVIKKKVQDFMSNNNLQSSSEVHGHRSKVIAIETKAGFLDVHALENWLV